MKIKRLVYGSLLSLSLFTTVSLFGVVAATNGVVGVYSGNECLAAEFDKVDNATYKAYIKGEGITSYQELDSELIREVKGNIRVDALGLEAGTYSLKLVINNSDEIEITNITVNRDDRSGYAHHNYNDGVGAYKDDGSLKDNAQVIYVTNENKNTVSYGSYIGLGDILSNAKKISNPLDIRILDAIETVQWNKVTYNSTTKSELVTEQSALVGSSNSKVYDYDIKNVSYSNDIENGITKLNGLTSYASYSSGKYDSYWNMMEVKEASNITVEGVGVDASIFQWGFTFSKCNSIEVRNLTFNNYTEDAIGIQGNDGSASSYGNYWIHNCTFNSGKNNWDLSYDQDKGDGDGSTDFKYARDLTISYCTYNGTHKSNLIGSNNASKQYNITIHHNYYNACTLRLPLVRQANVHIYNNYYLNTVSHGISVRANAFAFIENNYFAGKNPFMLAYEVKDGVDPVGTTIKAINNEFTTGIATGDSSDNGVALKANGIYVLTTAGSKVYSTNSSATRTTAAENSVCNPNGATSYANFDTNSDLFYYKDNQSDVSIMNSASELPALIPSVAGAAKFTVCTTYEVTSDEPEEVPAPVYNNTSYAKVLDEDFSVEKTIIETESTPTTGGIYKKTGSTGLDVTYNNNKLFVEDTSSTGTTFAYYMFSNTYTSGKVIYNVNITLGGNIGSKWNIVQFLDGNKNVAVRSCGNAGNNDPNKNKWGYSIDGGTNETASSLGVTKETTYNIVLTIDYDNQTAKVSIDNTELTITGWTFAAIKGVQFMTAGSATDRSFYVNSISITKDTTLKLGYQLGSYTQNNNTYNALRIIGKIEYNDIYTNLDDIESITINIVIQNASGVQTKVLNKNITNVYKSLQISNGDTITETGDNLRYYYTVIKGITASYSGYKIKATSTINLKNGVKVECSGFTYEIQ